MLVTQIEALTKGRYKIYADEQFLFVLYAGEMRQFGIAIGSVIEESLCEQIREEILTKRAKLRAMNLLMSKTYTQRQLEDKLRAGYYSDEIIEDTISYLKSYHYLDDTQYAIDYFTYHCKSKSQARIRQDLLRKGIDANVIKEAQEFANDNGDAVDEIFQIRKYLEKKHVCPQELDYKEKQKIIAALCRKGYSLDTIRDALLLDIT